MEKKTLVRDKMWLFASCEHDDDFAFGKDGFIWRNSSTITPTEGAVMLGLKNIMMVTSHRTGKPVPFSADAYGYMESFCRMDKVMWSITGSGGFRHGNEEEFICDIAEKYPNVMGGFLDDMFGKEETKEEDCVRRLKTIREKLDRAPRPMELWATCYVKDAKKYSPAMYDPIDVITIWNMRTSEIVNLEANLREYEEVLPNKRKVLGMYIFDYVTGLPVSPEMMEMQCETGLKWLKEGRIDGIIFLTNCLMGLSFPGEYWLREWLDKVGDQEL